MPEHMPPANEAIVLRIGKRFFYGFDRAGRICTSWSLAGAKLFVATDTVMIAIVQSRLKGKKHVSERVRVVLDETASQELH